VTEVAKEAVAAGRFGCDSWRPIAPGGRDGGGTDECEAGADGEEEFFMCVSLRRAAANCSVRPLWLGDSASPFHPSTASNRAVTMGIFDATIATRRLRRGVVRFEGITEEKREI
jgi:hypothetical protein